MSVKVKHIVEAVEKLDAAIDSVIEDLQHRVEFEIEARSIYNEYGAQSEAEGNIEDTKFWNDRLAETYIREEAYRYALTIVKLSLAY